MKENLQLKNLNLQTNLYQLELGLLFQSIYEYRPSSPEHFKSLEQSSEKQKFYQEIGFVAIHQGAWLGTILIKDISIQISSDQQVSISLVKTYLPKQIQKLSVFEQIVNKRLQEMLDPTIKEQIKQNSKKYKVGQTEIVVFPSFLCQLTYVQDQWYVAVIVSLAFKLVDSLLPLLLNKNNQDVNRLLVGRQVIQNYGNQLVFQVVNVDFEVNPNTTIKSSVENQIPYSEYYNVQKGIRIKDFSQPLILVKKSGAKINQHLAPQEQYLVPELLSLYNCISPQNENLLRNIHKFTQLLPHQIENYAEPLIKQLADQKVIKRSAHLFSALKLKEVSIQLGTTQVPVQKGVFSFRNSIYKSIQLKNWGIVCCEEVTKKSALKLYSYIQTVSGQMGIKIHSEPGFIVTSPGIDKWKAAIESDYKKFGAPQVLIALLRENEEDLANELKRYVTMQLKFPFHVMFLKTLESSKNPFEICSDLMMKIQVKIGGIPWQANQKNEFLSQYKVMQGGLAIFNTNNSYSISLVGGTTSQILPAYCYYRNSIEESEFTKNYETAIMAWAKSFVVQAKSPPEIVLLYRNECEPQDSSRIEREYECLQSIFKKVGEKTKTVNYSPVILYITVSTNNCFQLYSKLPNEKGETNLYNCSSGCAPIISSKQEKGCTFLLTTQESLTRTCLPTLFKVVDIGRMPVQHLIQFTYLQCFNFIDRKGASSQPAYLQYAHELMEFSLATNAMIPIEDKMANTLYFL